MGPDASASITNSRSTPQSRGLAAKSIWDCNVVDYWFQGGSLSFATSHNRDIAFIRNRSAHKSSGQEAERL